MEIIKNSTSSTPKCIVLIISSINDTLSLLSIQTTTTIIEQQDDLDFNGLDYTLNIVMPVIVGLFVALILGWMLIRYKMSAHQRSNYNGSIYCCPERCFEFCAKFFECKIKFKLPKLFKLKTLINSDNSNSNKRSSKLSLPFTQQELASLTSKNISNNLSNNNNNNNNNKLFQFGKRASVVSGESGVIGTIKEEGSTVSPSSSIRTQPITNLLPFRFLNRESFSSRRESVLQMPDLIKSNNFSMNLFHSFQSKNLTAFD